jgi:Terminase large subunit, T4likevirus-type, N-terminal
MPGTEGTVRGFSAVSLLLIDEASRVTTDQYRAVTPMLAVGNGDLWIMSTPHGKRGFFYEVWANGGPEWKKVRVTAEECPRITKAFLDEERAGMGERVFRQEYLCEFSDVETSLFDRDMLVAAIDKGVRPLFE